MSSPGLLQNFHHQDTKRAQADLIDALQEARTKRRCTANARFHRQIVEVTGCLGFLQSCALAVRIRSSILESEILTRPGDALQVALVFEFDLRLGA